MELEAQTSNVKIEDLGRQLARAKLDSEHDKSVLKDVTRLKESFKEQVRLMLLTSDDANRSRTVLCAVLTISVPISVPY